VSQGSFATRVELPPFDLSSLETVISALSSDNDEVVMGALDLLAAQDKVRLIPALLVYHPSPRVVERVLELFVQHDRRDFASLSDRLLRHESPQIRAAALRARLQARADLTLLRQAMNDPSPLVRATALVGVAIAGDDVEAQLAAAVESPDASARRALAAAIERQPSPIFDATLLRLLHDLDEGVRTEVIRAMRRRPSGDFIAPLVDTLATRSRAEVRRALVAHGERALSYLAQALVDEELPHEIRRHVPRTISQFPADRAAPILLARYEDETDGMVRFKILRGLGRLRAQNPTMAIDQGLLDRAIDGTLEAIRRLNRWRKALVVGQERTEVGELLATLLKDKQRHAIERLFRLLGLGYPDEHFERIYAGVVSSDKRRQAQSIELLSNLIEPPRRDLILSVLDEGADQGETPTQEEALGQILDATSEALEALAAYRAAELGLTRLRPRLEQLRERPSRFLPEVAERALAVLGQPRSEKTARA
jgi:HEAT repeat protein